MLLERLRGRKTNETLLRRGKVWRGTTMLIRYDLRPPRTFKAHASTDPVCFLGSFAPTSLHKSAVVRNRMRRRCREAVRVHLKECDNLPSMQLLIAPRSASLRSPASDIRSDVQAFFATLSNASSQALRSSS